jgi:hypothetical protein
MCKIPISQKDDDDIESLQATLIDGLGQTKDFQFCDEECLRVFLNARRKKAKASIIVDFVTKKFKKLYSE